MLKFTYFSILWSLNSGHETFFWSGSWGVCMILGHENQFAIRQLNTWIGSSVGLGKQYLSVKCCENISQVLLSTLLQSIMTLNEDNTRVMNSLTIWLNGPGIRPHDIPILTPPGKQWQQSITMMYSCCSPFLEQFWSSLQSYAIVTPATYLFISNSHHVDLEPGVRCLVEANVKITLSILVHCLLKYSTKMSTCCDSRFRFWWQFKPTMMIGRCFQF